MSGKIDRIRQTPADQRINRFAIDPVRSLGITIGSIVNGKTSERWRYQQTIAIEHPLEGIIDL